LIVFEERIACDCHAWQTGLRIINVILIRQAKFEPSIFTVTDIVPIFPGKASANLFRMPSYGLLIGKTGVRDNFFERFFKDLSARYDR